MKVVTWNIHAGFPLGKGAAGAADVDMDGIVKVLAARNADLIAINEIDLNCTRTERRNEPEILSRGLNMGVIFAQTLPLGADNGHPEQGEAWGSYGIAALSRKPLAVIEEFALPLPPGEEPRSVLIVRTREEAPVYFIVTHLPHRKGADRDRLRLECLKTITERVREKKYFPAIIAGDFNADYDTPSIDYLRSCWTIAGDDAHTQTWPADRPNIRLDYIAFYPQDAFRVTECGVVDERSASDHRPFAATLERR